MLKIGLCISGMNSDRLPDEVKSLEYSEVREAHLLRVLSSRELQFKEFNQPEPTFRRDSNLMNDQKTYNHNS